MKFPPYIWWSFTNTTFLFFKRSPLPYPWSYSAPLPIQRSEDNTYLIVVLHLTARLTIPSLHLILVSSLTHCIHDPRPTIHLHPRLTIHQSVHSSTSPVSAYHSQIFIFTSNLHAAHYHFSHHQRFCFFLIFFNNISAHIYKTFCLYISGYTNSSGKALRIYLLES